MKNEGTDSFISNSNKSKLREKNPINIIACPYCGKDVKLISFGSGWVGTCCGKVVYNSDRLPVDP